jgi:hypothetical protein
MASNASPLWPIQTAIYSLLTADVALSGKVSGVYDEVPEGATFPYVVIGEHTLNPQGAHDRFGARTTITLHAWSAYHGTLEVAGLLDDLVRIIDHQTVTVDGHATVAVRLEQVVTMRDPGDADLRHGVVRFALETEHQAA